MGRLLLCLFLTVPAIAAARTYGPRPYVVVTTGKQWPIPGGRLIAEWMRVAVFDRLRDEFDAEIVSNSWNCYADGAKEWDCATELDDQYITDLADDLGSLPGGRPIILVGHSYGADSQLRAVAGSWHADNAPVRVPIFALATIDPTSTAGWRLIGTGFHFRLPPGLRLFYNRWQRNAPVPWNFGDDGRMSPGCDALVCDETEQAYRRNADGSYYDPDAVCGFERSGWTLVWRCWPERSTHHSLVEDGLVQAQLYAQLADRLARRRVATLTSRYNGKLLCAEGGGGPGTTIEANRSAALGWEHFGLIDLNEGALESGDRVRLASYEGYFARLDEQNRLRADLVHADDRASFQVIRVSPSRPTAEIFPGDVVRLVAPNGLYLLTATDGSVRGWNGLAILGQWDFTIGGKLR